MRKWIHAVTSVFICILLSACAHTEKQAYKDVKAEVERLGDRAETAFMSGDVDTMLQYYSDDIISMPNGYPMVIGKADLKRKTEAILSSGLKFESLESTTMDVRTGGEYVYEVGTFSQAIVIPGTSEPMKSVGKYVTVWKRQPNGQLKIIVEMYNSDTSE